MAELSPTQISSVWGQGTANPTAPAVSTPAATTSSTVVRNGTGGSPTNVIPQSGSGSTSGGSSFPGATPASNGGYGPGNAAISPIVSGSTLPNGVTTDSSGNIISSTNPQYQVGQQYTGPNANYNAAQNSLLPQNLPSEEQFYQNVYSQLQPVIDSINQAEQYAETSANIQSTQATSAQNFSMNAQGLAGSSEADTMAGQNQQTLSAAISAAKVQQSNQIAQLTQWAVPQAYNEYTAAQSRNDTLSQNYVQTQQANAENAIKGIAATGVSLSDFQSQNPTEYNNLLQYFSGDANAMAASYIANIPQAQMIGDPVYNGTNATFLYLDPVTKQYKSTTVNTGANLDGSNTVTNVVPGVGVVVTDKNTGQGQVIGGTANPYYMANQAATLNSKNAMLTSRYGTAVNAIIKQLGYTTTSNPLTMYANSINYTAKLDAAYQASTNPSTPDKGVSDVDLIDSYIKIANGGGQITEGQLSAINKSLNLSGNASITLDKLTGTSELLTDEQRKTMYQLSQANIKQQESNAQAAQQVIQSRAAAAGIPANMVGTPQQIAGLSASSNPSADMSTTGGTTVGTVVQDANGLPDGTTGTDDNGNTMIVQGGQWVSQ